MAVSADDPNLPKEFKGFSARGLREVAARSQSKKPVEPDKTPSARISLAEQALECFKGKKVELGMGEGALVVDLEAFAKSGLEEAKRLAAEHRAGRQATGAPKTFEQRLQETIEAGAGGNPRMAEAIEHTLKRTRASALSRLEP